MDAQRLQQAACDARLHAYAPYSGYHVGAAVETAAGEIFTGCNVENSSYGLTICAERVAVSAAVAAGHREFAGIAVATSNGGPPCGACRQFLAEFATTLPVLLVDGETGRLLGETDLQELLPLPFHLQGDVA